MAYYLRSFGMQRPRTAVIWPLITAMFLIVTRCYSDVVVTVIPGNQIGTHGVTLTYSVSIANNDGSPLFLNGSAIKLLASGVEVDEVPFLVNAPRTLNPNAEWSGAAFKLIIGTNTPMLSYTGTFEISGGADASAGEVIATSPFEFTIPGTVAELASLVADVGVLSPLFESGTTNYTIIVPDTASSIVLKSAMADERGTKTVNGIAIPPDTASKPINLSPGANTVVILVTAEDGISKKIYTLNVLRGNPGSADLVSLIPSDGVLVPSFQIDTTNYTAHVPSTTASIAITPTLADSAATLTVNGAPVVSGSASPAIGLGVGPNPITTVVSAAGEMTVKTYTVHVIRDGDGSSADLFSLRLSSGELTSPFSSDITNYVATVPNSTRSLTLTPIPLDSQAAVTINGIALDSGSASDPIDLSSAPNPITILVTAGNGVAVKTYTINVARRSGGIEDWRATYFGITANTGEAADLADPDADGQNNLFEYVAGLVPTNPVSHFNVRMEYAIGQKAVVFSPVVDGRTYTVTTKSSLTDAAWTPLENFTITETGLERRVLDLSPGDGRKFYRVEITKE